MNLLLKKEFKLILCADEKNLVRGETFKSPQKFILKWSEIVPLYVHLNKCTYVRAYNTYITLLCSCVCMWWEARGERFTKQASARGAMDTVIQFCCRAIPIFLTRASCCVSMQLLCSQTPIFVVFNDSGDKWTYCWRVTCTSNTVVLLTSPVVRPNWDCSRLSNNPASRAQQGRLRNKAFHV